MAKKQFIIENSLKLFAEQGFESTSVQQITELCGISKGAFYLSFKSKDELIIALIDHFLMQITSDIDQSVRTCKVKEQMLYEFYYSTFHSFNKHSDFAKILIKEQVQPFNKELIVKFSTYESRINESILYLLHQLYEDNVQETIYDLLICMKSFMKIYVELYLIYNVKLDVDVLAKSFAEKTNILAQNVTSPFLSKETYELISMPCHSKVTIDQLISSIEQTITEVEDLIEIESLEILQQNIQSPTPSLATIKGLIENVKNNPQCKWTTYLIREYYQL